MRNLFPLISLPLCALLLALPGPAAARAQDFAGAGKQHTDTVLTPHVRAELLVHAPQGIAPGSAVWMGLLIEHQPEWHTYWVNPGDSGLPTELAWTLPEGIEASPIQWPAPQKLRIGPLVNYGYEGTVLLPVKLNITEAFKTPVRGLPNGNSDIDIGLQAHWLVCRQECIPESGQFNIQVPTQGSTALHAALFARARNTAPLFLEGAEATILPSPDDARNVRIHIAHLPPDLHGLVWDVFPQTAAVFDDNRLETMDWPQQWQDDAWQATLPLSPYRAESPPYVDLLLKRKHPDTDGQVSGASGNAHENAPDAWRIRAQVKGTWPAAAPLPELTTPALPAIDSQNSAATPPSGSANPLGRTTLWTALAGALLGGLILNLMPCVLPVLAIKVLQLTQHSASAGMRVSTGLAYSVGVMASFMALGGLMLALRAAGAQLGWGFQLQSPAVLASLALLFTLIGLNLAGVFELRQVFPGRFASLQFRHPALDALLTGVLVVVLASPCTAPFMGASLGFALGLPSAQALLLFASLGLGMALPFLLIALAPGAARVLPRPGAWMHVFRQCMAFPMFATVAFLVWVLGQQSGIDGASALLGILVLVAALVWALAQKGRVRWITSSIALIFLLLIGGWLWPHVLRPAAAATIGSTGPWQAWEPDRVAELHSRGQVVFVDFTAAWCITCQYNKNTTLADTTLLAEMQQRNIALLRADWTRQDPTITQALQQLGRSGVPVYAFYPLAGNPIVLSEIISTSDVRAAMAQL